MMKVCILGFLFLFFGFSNLAFAPIADDANPEEVLRLIELHKKEAAEAKASKSQAVAQPEEKPADISEPTPIQANKTYVPAIKFWLIAVVIVISGIFISSKIKSDNKK